jgi:hypothetical protein
MKLTDWLLIEVALLFIGLAKISQTKSGCDHPSVIESPLGLRAQLPPHSIQQASGQIIKDDVNGFSSTTEI